MSVEWQIKSIKHWEDGHWDALVRISKEGRGSYDRYLSTDGFHWKNKYGRKVRSEIQDELTRCIGDMLDLGCRVVIF